MKIIKTNTGIRVEEGIDGQRYLIYRVLPGGEDEEFGNFEEVLGSGHCRNKYVELDEIHGNIQDGDLVKRIPSTYKINKPFW